MSALSPQWPPIMGLLLDWIRAHETLLAWLSIVSAVTFVGSLMVIPWLIIRIPADYFLTRRSLLHPRNSSHPAIRLLVLFVKNSLGLLLVLAGIAMLVLPGQGIIAIVVGLMLTDFPGKFALERWLIRRPAVLHTMNWVRTKANAPPLRIHNDGH